MKFFAKLLQVISSVLFSVIACSAVALTTEDFSRLPDANRLVLSPDGKKLASIVRLDSGPIHGNAVQVMDLASKKINYALFTDNSKFFLNWIQWKDNTTLLTGAFTPSERETYFIGKRIFFKTRDFHLMIINTETNAVTVPFKKKFLSRYKILPSGLDEVIDPLRNDPDHILMLMPGVDRGFPTDPLVYKVNINTQKESVLHPSESNVYEWGTDQQHNVRVSSGMKDELFSTNVRDVDSDKWRNLWPYKIFSEDRVEPLGFDQDPNVLYIRAYHQKRLAIFKVNLKDSDLKRELVVADPKYDVLGNLIYSPLTRKAIGVSALEEGGTHFFDAELQALQKKINKAIPDNRNYIYSITDDLQKFLVFSTSSTDSGTYYLGQMNPIKLDAIAYRYNKLTPELMSKSERLEYKARDGLTIEAFLTLPNNTGNKKLPTLMFPHGGPIARDNDEFDYWTQFFVNKGYAVLQMNFRGSNGQGIELRNAGLKNWGKEMQDDIEDGARHLIAKGVADPHAIGIVGASYGGYASLMGAVKTPDFYRCAISVNGVSNVYDLVKDNRAFWRSYNVIDEQIGNDNATLKSISPVNFADKIKAPVLLVHGTDDRQVEFKHSYEMRDALQKAKKDVTFVELPSEDHYLLNEANRIETFRAMDKFLNRCMPVKP